jgi:hypothetical protein
VSRLCGNCLYWNPTDEAEMVGICRIISETSRVGMAGRPEPYAFSSKLAAVLVDGKRYMHSELQTSEDFGCVQFEEREAS